MCSTVNVSCACEWKADGRTAAGRDEEVERARAAGSSSRRGPRDDRDVSYLLTAVENCHIIFPHHAG